MNNDIKLVNISKQYGHNIILENMNLTIPSGKRTVLLGPSGCGKSTILRMIAGLEEVSSGQLYLGDKIANHLAPGERSVAMVFQNYALYPHLSVKRNIEYALNNCSISADEGQKRVTEALEMLRLSGYEERKPKELSGGQRQRVALARALVKHAPFFLLDEPLSNLDAQLRTHARTELVRLHEWMNSTMVYVTHDQVEAMTIGQHIAVMKDGKLQQFGTPEEVYNEPLNTFVASFIGNPPMNLLAGTIHGGRFVFEGGSFPLPPTANAALSIKDGHEILLGIRPEDIKLSDSALHNNHVPLKVTAVENWGQQRIYTLSLGALSFLAAVPAEQELYGDKLYWNRTQAKFYFFDRKDGNRIAIAESLEQEAV